MGLIHGNRVSYFLAQKCVFVKNASPAGRRSWSDKREKAHRENRWAGNNWVTPQLLGDSSSSFLPAGEDPADIDEVIADHTEPDPALHAALPLVAAAVEPVAALHHADAPFTTGPPFLAVAEPGFLLFPLPFGALGVAIGNADPLDTLFVRRLFIAGGVEARVARDQARDASQLLLVRLDSRNQQGRVAGSLLINFITSDDLILRFLDLHHLAELGGFARLALPDDFGARLEDADQFLGHVCIATEDPRTGLLHHLLDSRRHRVQLFAQAFEGGLPKDVARCFHTRRDLPREALRLSHHSRGRHQ